MSPQATKIYEDYLALPADEQEEFISLVLEGRGEPENRELSPEWQEEIALRIQEIDQGKVELIPWEDIDRRLNDKYGPIAD